MPACEPFSGTCDKKAREAILHRASENMIGNGMAVTTVSYRCGGDHPAASDAMAMMKADPGCEVLVFSTDTAFEPGTFYHVAPYSRVTSGGDPA